MFMRSKIISRFMTITLISLFILTSLVLSDYSFARDRDGRGGKPSRVDKRDRDGRGGKAPRVERRDQQTSPRYQGKRVVKSPRVYRKGHTVSKLPRGYRRILHNKKPYYYYSGSFYRRAPSGFIVIGAPYGAIVFSLPVGYQRFWVDNAWYYAYGGAFYRRSPYGYVVVEAPRNIVIEEEVTVLVQPPEPYSGEVSVIASILNVRSGPSLSYPVIYQIHKGYILEVHGKTTGWLYVQLPNGEFGWVMNIYTNRLNPPGSG